MIFYGVLLGIALSWVVRHVDSRLAEYEKKGPFARLYSLLIQMPTWRVQRKILGPVRRVATRWWLNLPPVRNVLSRRRWRVTYVAVCQYGSDPDLGGAPPRRMATSWHWTERGAEWHRRHRPNYAGLWSFYCVTDVEHDPTGPYDLAEMVS